MDVAHIFLLLAAPLQTENKRKGECEPCVHVDTHTHVCVYLEHTLPHCPGLSAARQGHHSRGVSAARSQLLTPTSTPRRPGGPYTNGS